MKTIITGYQVNEDPFFESDHTIIFTGRRVHDDTPVILKFLKESHPTPTQISRLKHEYEMIKTLDSPYIVQAYAMEKFQNSYVLIMEQVNGSTLANILLNKKKLDLREFLELAIRITEGLAVIHRHHIVHNDLNPGNIMLDAEKREVKIIDFNISTSLPKNWIPVMNPSQLQGTLPYLSPEQTGRMNRGIDYRTDFYSLGITFYQLLTGRLPCESEDPMELILFHIAFLPKAPHEVDSSIPEVVSSIVMKLIAKKAEDRYQNTEGLLYDLRNCLNQLIRSCTITPFSIGSKDLSRYFQISDELYGRDEDVKILLQCFERASKGAAELLLISGYAGIGKTSLVNEIHKPVVRGHGYFISGKFEQLKHNIPYTAFIGAFSELINQILMENQEKITQFKKRVLDAVGELGQIIIDVIPNLALIIGKQQPLVKKLDPIASQNRFKNLLQKFIAALPSAEHPLTLFLDDLQSADSASLKLLEALLTNQQAFHLLIIGAYRSNEVTVVHPLMITLGDLKKQNVSCETINLMPLKLIHIEEMLSQSLHQEIKTVSALAEVCYEKTKGNPFFLKQLLHQLYKEQLIEFDFQQNLWNWDIEKIREKKITDNVVDLMIEKIGQLSVDAQQLIKLAACIGNQFDSDILSLLCQTDHEQVFSSLEELRKENLILKKGGTQNIPSYQFAHDRIQQAAYLLMGEDERKIAHIEISRLLLQRSGYEKSSEDLFDVANHFNRGIKTSIPTIVNSAERKEMTDLNLKAAKMALSAAAYEPALRYVEYALKCTEDTWESNYGLLLEMHALATESAFLSSKIELMEKYAEVALNHVKNRLDEYPITQVKIQYLYSQFKYKEVLKTAINLLGTLGIKIPSHPNRLHAFYHLLKTRFLLSGKPINELANLPKMTEYKLQMIMKILVGTIYATTFSDNPYFYVLFTCHAVNLSLQYGNSEESAIAYELYAILCCGPLKSIEKGYEIGELAIKLVNESKDKGRKTRICFSNYTIIKPLKVHLRAMLPKLLENYEDGLDSGQVYYGRLGIPYYYEFNIFAGLTFKDLLDKVVLYENQFINLDKSCYFALLLIHQLIIDLSTENPVKIYDESHLIASFLEANVGPYLFLFYFHKLYLNYLFENYDEARGCIEQCDFYEKKFGIVLPIFFNTTVANSFKSLLLLDKYLEAAPKEKRLIRKAVSKNQKKLKRFADLCPQNHLHRYYLVEAEITSKVLNNPIEALKLYNKAISLANENGYLNDEALANELQAKYYLSQGSNKIGIVFLTDAIYCYSLWGADAKVKQLENKYSHLLESKKGLMDSFT